MWNLWRPISNGFSYVFGTIDTSKEEKYVSSTRFKLTLVSFFVISIAFGLSYYRAFTSNDIEVISLFLSFCETMGYTFGALVAAYLGARTIRGSGNVGRPHIGGDMGYGGGFYKDKQTTQEEQEDGPQV